MPKGGDMADGDVGLSEEYGVDRCGHCAEFSIDGRGCTRKW